MQNPLNIIKQRLGWALSGGQAQAAPAGAPVDGGLSGALSSVGHMVVLPSRTPPDGLVYIENNCLKAASDLTEYERDRRELIEPLMAEWAQMYLDIADLKARIAQAVGEIRKKHISRNTKRSREGKTSSLTLFSLDRSLSLSESHSDRVRLDDVMVTRAKELFDECFKEWGEESRKEMRQAVEIAFKRKSSGDYSRQKIVELCQIESDDPRWNEAIAIIRKAELVDGVAIYYLVSVRDAQDKYHPLPLDISSVRPYRKPGEPSRAEGGAE